MCERQPPSSEADLVLCDDDFRDNLHLHEYGYSKMARALLLSRKQSSMPTVSDDYIEQVAQRGITNQLVRRSVVGD